MTIDASEEKEIEVGWTIGEAVKAEVKEVTKEEVKEVETEAAAGATPAATETSAILAESASNKLVVASSPAVKAVQAVVYPVRTKPTSPHVLLCSMVRM